MANTERLNALRKVALAREEAGKARIDSGLTDTQRALLNDTYDALLDAESTLLHEVLQDEIEKLEEQAEVLAKLASRLQRSSDALKQIGATVKTVANVLGVLAEIVAKAVTVGPVSYTHLRAHETVLDLVCRLLLEKKKNNNTKAQTQGRHQTTRHQQR